MTALGQAYIDVHANTTQFGPEVKTKIRAALEKIEAKVKIVPDDRGFKTAVREAVKNLGSVKLKIEPEGFAAFRAQVQRELRNIDPVKVKILPEGIAALRAQIQRDLRNVDAINIRLAVSQAELTRIRNEIERTLATLPPIQLRFDSAHVLSALAAVTTALNAATAAAERLARATGQASAASPRVSSLGGAVRDLGSAFEGVSGIAENLFDKIKSGAETAIKGIIGIDTAIAAFGIKGTLDLEQLETAIAGIVRGNALAAGKTISFADALGQAKQQIKEIQALGKIAPQFSLTGLATAARNLQTIGLSGESAIATTKNLANALVAAGNASDDALRGAVLPLLQAASTGKFLGQDLNQLAQRLPGVFSRGDVLKRLREILDAELAVKKGTKLTEDQYKSLATALSSKKLSTAEFDKIRQAGLPAKETIAAVLQSLKESPVAADALKNASNTVRGQLFSLRRTVEQNVLGLFEPVRGQLRDALKDLAPKVNDAFANIAPGIQDFVLKAIPILGQLIDPISKIIGAVNGGLSSAFDAVAPHIVPVVRTIADFISKIDFGKVVGGIVSFIQSIGPGLKGFASFFVSIFKSVKNLAPVFRAVINGVGPAFALVGKILEFVTKAVGRFFAIPIVQKIATFAAGFIGIGGAVGVVFKVFEKLFKPIKLAIEATKSFLGALNKIPFVNALLVRLVNLVLRIGTYLHNLGVLGRAALGVIVTAVGSVLSAFGSVGRAIRTVVGGALRVLAETALTVFDAIISAAAHAFGWIPGIGGKLQEANAAFDNFAAGVRASLDSIPRDIPVRIDVAVVTSQFSGNGGSASNSNIALGNEFNAEKQQRIAAKKASDAAKSAANKVADDTFDQLAQDFSGTGGSAGTGGGGSAAKAKTAAQKAADRFAQFLKDIALKLKDLKSTLTTGTGKEVNTALRGLERDITNAFKGKKTKLDDKLVTFIEKQNDLLKKKIADRVTILKTLEDAQAKAKEVSDNAISFANITSLDFSKVVATTKKLITETLDVAGSIVVTGREIANGADAATDAVKHSGQEFADALKTRLKSITDFNDNIRKLAKEGLNKETIDQIISAGVEGGGATAEALAKASKATIDQINTTQTAIDNQSKKLGNAAADSLFRAGKSVVDGLIEGLKTRKKDVTDAIGGIAAELIARIKKDLKIHSPSRLMRELFRFVGHGMVLGLHDSVKGVGDASARLARAAVPRMESVAIGDLQAMAAARSMVQLRAVGASGGGLTSDDINRVVDAVAQARPAKEIHAPITQHFASPVTPAAAKVAFSTVGRR